MMEILVTFLLTGSLIQGVFCGFIINLPQTVEAVKGSCVFIPCTFDIDQQHENLLTDSAKRIWYKEGNPATEVFDSSRPNTGLLKGEIFGTATQKNCSTRFDDVNQSHNGSYYFRLEANGNLKYNYKEPKHNHVQIGVLGSPPKPTVRVFKDQQQVMKTVEVMEGSSVSLRCSTKIFCPSRPPSLTWSSSLNKNVTGRQYQNQTELISDLNFTVSHRHHGVTFTCSATHQLQKKNTTTRRSRVLQVQYAPKNTSVMINPAGLVLEGRSVTLSCSSDANPAVNYTWYRDTEELLNPVQTGPNLTINNTDPTHRGRYYCRAENKHGTQNTSVLLDVQYAPKNTSVMINPAGLVLEGRSVTLSCSSDANPAVNYTWYRDTEDLLKPVQTGPNLTINNTDPTHSGRYYCRAENKHGTQNTSVLLDVQYAPKNTSLSAFPSSSVMEGKPVALNCRTDANPAELNYTWYRETGSQIEFLQTGYNHTYIVTTPTHGAWYGCNAQNQHGQRNATIQLDVQCVFCDFSINLPQRVEALQGSCVFIPCTFDIDQQLNSYLTDSAKRKWFKGVTPVFASNSPNTGLLKGEIFGTATQKNCSTRFDNVNQSHNGSYYFRLEANGNLQYNYKEPKHNHVQIGVLGSPPKPTLRVFKDQQEVMETEEVMEGSSVSLRCSTKIFCPSRPPSLTWSSSLNENITGRQYQNQTELISDLNFTVSHRHHGVTFNCSATHQLQQKITTQESRMLRVQYAPKNTSVRINPAGLVLEGRSVTLSCSSDANPAVNYTWYRDTEELLNPVQTGPDLTINNTDPTHSGRYYCRAENKHGTQNTSVLLDVQYAPKNTSVMINPAGLVLEGRSLTLSCSSDANPAVNYTWYRDTEELLKPVQTGPDLIINNTDPTHRGRYYCRAENKHGTQNTSVLLDVQYAPKNTSVRINPAGLVLLEGRSVTLSCSSDANPAVNYTWYRDTEELLNPVQTGPNLTINNTDPTHRGRYYCRAENKHGTQNTSVLLDVQYAPKNTSVRINPAGLVLEGRSVTLSCSSDANPAVNYTWYRDTEELLNPVQTGANLTINNTDPTHRGRYYCRAENKHGTQNTSVLLDVQYAPKNTSVRINPAGLVLEGRSVTLSCSSDANPAVNYTWYRDTEELLNPVQTGPNLIINNTDPTHRGRYYCRAENKHGTQNTSVLLDVQYAPKNTSVRINPAGLVLEGRSVTLSCSSDANPAVNYTWYRDTEELLNPVQTGANLTINNTDPAHRGRYYCRAENKHGTQNTSVLLDVQYAPKNTSLSVFPSSSVMEGKPVALNCRTDANPAVNYTWYRETGSQIEFLQTGYNHTYIVTNPTHGAWYSCNAQNQHGQRNATIQLDVQSAPKISSSCSRNSVIACVCEAHGNPCPTLEWRLSGHVLANSTETSIREETLGSTGVKSVLTTRQSLTDTDVLQCFSSNTYGRASQQFQTFPSTQETSFHHPSVLLGAAVGASVMMIVCIVMLCCERKRKEKPSETRQDDTSGLILTQTAVALDNDGQFVYGNKGMLSSTAPSSPESLHYSSIDFTNTEPPSGEITGIASLTSEYATVRHRPAGATDTENNTSTSETEPKKQDVTAEITDTSSPASEDVIYENTSHRYRQKEPLISADDAEKQD
ncbi:hypothetical protein G5714_005155 [Onychostoma macrolepis]|uniref:Ig-like domain-containing protein n=1 Tax=Onychostoma macrolepis TaxID=369639 RepID=A0A7J6D711_9TELE|nr:hypothetical protein G5714_005155 [Onychostoma macrolepis]